MAKITKFDKPNIKVLRNEIDSALAEVGKAYGLNLSIGNIRFRDDEFTTKLTVVVAEDGTGGEKVGTDQRWKRQWPNALNYGFTQDDLGKVIVMGRQRFELAGWRGRARHKVVAKKPDGKFAALPHQDVLYALGR